MKNSDNNLSNMFTVAPEVWGRKHVFVNFYMVRNADNNDWVLVDAGLKWSACKIKEMAEHLFGNIKPKAIILTHGHFDHVGAVKKLAKEWDVPVFAHPLEMPYLTGKSDYAPGDSTVGGGLMASMACLYPISPINIWKSVKALPADGSVPYLKGWKWLHTPGHSAGHISLFREADKLLIAGDAFVTTKSASVIATFLQSKTLSGPPKYFTPDWQSAKSSFDKLHALHPKIAATGHGKPMHGKELQQALASLSENFYRKAVPQHGRYVPNPAIANENGVIYVPPKKPSKKTVVAAEAFAIAAVVGFAAAWLIHKKNDRRRLNEELIEMEYNY